ncbi:MAG: hypothetical protein CM15mP47_1830 [Methanobacteriota archaeon]|nr:MAG: hypothetical protein CM15mP47_1830 [Euryarchaeota archaeon]
MNGISKPVLLEAVVHTPGIDGAMTVTLKFFPPCGIIMTGAIGHQDDLSP